jgi:hypothetical protein
VPSTQPVWLLRDIDLLQEHHCILSVFPLLRVLSGFGNGEQGDRRVTDLVILSSDMLAAKEPSSKPLSSRWGPKYSGCKSRYLLRRFLMRTLLEEDVGVSVRLETPMRCRSGLGSTGVISILIDGHRGTSQSHSCQQSEFALAGRSP